ncbi:nickel-dependent hydrogenase large subunit [Methylocystis sp. B8]|uniref:nickel-dependent hydrogenase large subunit n=1 Tax=Methylocystis sp. B8 TaxID=544938 RepID=UPI0010FF5C24|nr:nickel-dependent hydrogenase large subunit [Methylocystis sp. B8]TLG78763.1 hydrogenase [Methylocystis sp. B8]
MVDLATRPSAPPSPKKASPNLVEKNWDPITRIVGSLGIFTKIDFENRHVAECHSTSSIFRGYSIFMKGKDPRDAHFITSRICGICGDNHATCSVYAQNMAYGIKPPPLADWIINLGEAAEYMFDHNIFQDNLVGVDFCEQMIKETNPSVWAKAQRTPAPHADAHGYRTIAEIMTALNPFSGEFYRETLIVSRYTREMFALMEGRHVHPSTLYPGGVGTVPSNQLFTEYLTRLVRYAEFMKKCVPLHDDLFDFFYEALPGYEEVGRRRILMGCWGSFQDPDHCDYNYKNMTHWGRKMFVTPGVVVDGKLVTTDLVDINLQIRILRGQSYYESWDDCETFVKNDPLGNPVDQKHPWNQTTIPRPQKRDFDKNYSWVMCPRWLDKSSGDHLALDTGGGAFARLFATALAGLVDIGGYVKATGDSVKINLPKTALKPAVEFEWKVPKWSNAIERNRARTYFQAYCAAAAYYFLEQAFAEIQAGRTKTWTEFKVPEEAIGCGFHEAVRGVLSHHLVIRDKKIANYHPYPPTPWNATPRDDFGTPGPYEDSIQNTPIFEENGPDNFKGIDIMRAVRSFDPCLPCGVHMYVGGGKTIETRHSPMFGASRKSP